MATFHFIRLLCLIAVLVRSNCFKQSQLSRIIRCDTSISASSTRSVESSSMLTRAASVIVGSTIPFLFQSNFDLIDHAHLTFQSSPQHAQADSTGKVQDFDSPSLIMSKSMCCFKVGGSSF